MTAPLFALQVAASATVLLCCGVLLLYNRAYHAGAIGLAGLGMLSLAALGRLAHLLDRGLDAWVSTQSVLLWVGLALFLGRHVVKFLFRASRRGPSWYEGRRSSCGPIPGPSSTSSSAATGGASSRRSSAPS